ncbi:hypothetical protein LAHI110946_00005 [Lactococcus hircilactis]
MKFKFLLTNIMLQVFIVVISLFEILTQMNAVRQPTKLVLYIILIFAVFSTIINIVNYIIAEKE